MTAHSAIYYNRKSGHFVDAINPDSPCWCGDVHFYADQL